MIRSPIAALAIAILCWACGPTETETPASWDCGDSCVAGCAFLSPFDYSVCIEDCKACDGRDSPAFTAPPIGGDPAWTPESRADAGAD